ncbi:hypothetical protein [Pseudonocardia kunmingensis]|nr:hypothetical protein [Pseudonocardia kunmingensis]
MSAPISGVAVARVLWGVVTPAYIAVQIIVVSAWPVPYDLLHHTVSDLG